MDLASKKLPLALIGVLLVILVAQFAYNDSRDRFVDPATCEIWERGDGPAGRQYTGEFDQKCADLKALAP